MQDNKYLLYKLNNIEGFGTKTINIILDRIKIKNKTLDEFFNITEKDFCDLFPEFGKGRFSKVNYDSLFNFNDEIIEKEYNRLIENGIKIITLFDNEYPKIIIKKFENAPPPILFCKGKISLLNANSVAIVGSRDVDIIGLGATKKIAKHLAENGYNVVSGYAKGVDTNAHLGALECDGTTTAVLSCGINQIPIKKEIQENYNWENDLLLVSQFKPNEPWSARNAMIRNKLVCALSKAVVVILSGPEKDQNGKMSGTFDAGKTALKFGIPLLVLSPKFFSFESKGNIQLIKMGAKEITDCQKVAELIKSDVIYPSVVYSRRLKYCKQYDNSQTHPSDPHPTAGTV
ncbi:DNA-processing protein DprA [Patescibacteria group bacterium]|nr:DNA-processing protein DprA [Patescibacteria group bacterium]